MKGRVTGHYVAIKPDLIEEVSKGGIVLATDYDEKEADRQIAASVTGTILSVGPDAWRAFGSEKPWAKVGDRVYYVRHVAKVIDDKEDVDRFGKPRKIFIIVDENVTWNLDAENDNE